MKKIHKSEGSFYLFLGSMPNLPVTVSIHSCAQDIANVVALQQQEHEHEYQNSEKLADYKSAMLLCNKNIGMIF